MVEPKFIYSCDHNLIDYGEKHKTTKILKNPTIGNETINDKELKGAALISRVRPSMHHPINSLLLHFNNAILTSPRCLLVLISEGVCC